MKLNDFTADTSPRVWLVEGLIPYGHAVLMGGLPGVGKSWIADALAIHVASGKPYLGLRVVSGPVILVDEDTPQDELQSRLLRLAKGLQVSPADLPIMVHSLKNMLLDNEKSLRILESDIAETGAILVIFDCLGKLMGKFSEDAANDANRVGAVWNRLKARGVTVLMLHHLNKGEGNIPEDFVRRSRGSGALVANSDTAFGIEPGRRNPTCFNVYPIERRRKLGIREGFGIEVEEDKELTWARLKRVEITRELSRLAQDIVVLFCRGEDVQESMTFHDIRKKLAGMASDPDTRSALHELEERGILIHTRGAHNVYVYRLAP